MKQISTWLFIQTSLEKELDLMLLYVLESKGSSPGRQGFFMAINAKYEMQGSIGGGIMEHKFVELAKEKLQQHKNKSLIRKQVHSKSAKANQSGMICSGEQTILLYHLENKDAATISNIIACLENNKKGSLQLNPNGIFFTTDIVETSFTYTDDETWNYQQKLGFQNKLYIVGGGHCALAFSNLMRTLDFYIYLIDDRNDLNTFIENNSAHEKIIVEDYTTLAKYIPSGENNFVVLMTFGYRTDAIALRAIINNHYTYLGMLGSKTKIEQLFSELKQEGIAAEKIDKVYAPIGIDIKSQTPEEIAVSIGAEIVKVKNY